MGLGDIFFWLLLAALVALVVITIARGSLGGDRGAGMPSMTALHDLSPADKQRAMEIIVEKKAGKKWMEQESGKTEEPESPPEDRSGLPTPPA